MTSVAIQRQFIEYAVIIVQKNLLIVSFSEVRAGRTSIIKSIGEAKRINLASKGGWVRGFTCILPIDINE